MKWPLSRENPKLINFFFLTDTMSPRISWKGSNLTVSGMWPLCYTWIGYRQANGSPWVPLSEYVDQRTKFQCQHSFVADDSNLDVLEPFQDTLGYCSGWRVTLVRNIPPLFRLIDIVHMCLALSRPCAFTEQGAYETMTEAEIRRLSLRSRFWCPR